MTRHRCKDCRWWDWDRDLDDEMPDRAMCEVTWNHSTAGRDHPESKAFASGNGEISALWTQPDFGCVQFEQVRPPLADHSSQ